ncbi:ABC transporter [Azospirillum brasilense]|uniref:Transporter substrate-binding domain-containing protein n=2 Tax=Azospirillum brasilense TaxID=192 RepID=A0ABU4PD28_AZOBR|nr:MULTISPECIES: transporter substrate-binding domain-containing protein [Azospirillum]ALJ35569.1 ABC transporter [Azospirillum brasilense]MDW7555562.1 transporter substrate-binding domain-containing protein [Azospirillum brasilense]MDW7595489.1 transporter substrate-binding domain-containing protein [Azospirillum brasilense]MDW7630494.1 transporter substrate-binding domain-containing protein [Azospirillum brasilense]MDX5954310.1 transporter substrate-binding domain-containing protein [Azospir
MAKAVARRTVLALALAGWAASGLPSSGFAATAESTPAESAAAPVTVKVGGYEFPPYVTESGGGVTQALLDLLNAEQSDFRFELVRTSPQRRYEDMERGRFDMIAFESLAWGWKGRPVEASRVFLRDAEVFVAKAGPGMDQGYFDRLDDKTILGRLGYHYAFAGMTADPEVLEKRFNTRLTVTHEGNVRSVAAGRAALAIVTRSFLAQFLKANPDMAPHLLVSDRTDQIYEHTILVRRDGPVGIGWVNGTLDRLERSGVLPALWVRQGIAP